jgi:hypothetical protein
MPGIKYAYLLNTKPEEPGWECHLWTAIIKHIYKTIMVRISATVGLQGIKFTYTPRQEDQGKNATGTLPLSVTGGQKKSKYTYT